MKKENLYFPALFKSFHHRKSNYTKALSFRQGETFWEDINIWLCLRWKEYYKIDALNKRRKANIKKEFNIENTLNIIGTHLDVLRNFLILLIWFDAFSSLWALTSKWTRHPSRVNSKSLNKEKKRESKNLLSRKRWSCFSFVSCA